MGDKFTKKKRGRQTKGDKRLLNEKFKKIKKNGKQKSSNSKSEE